MAPPTSILRKSAVPLPLLGVTLTLILIVAATGRLFRINELPPPTLNYDEAYYAVDALHVLQGQHAIFFPGNNGHEPLYIYLEAGMFKLFGVSAVTVRVLSALLGIATVLAVFWAGAEIFWHDSAPDMATGLLSALALAGLYWHISYSRGGLRVISFPLFETLTMGAVARSLRTKKAYAFVGAGLLLGISLYTYSIVRLLPFVVLAGFCLWWLRDAPTRTQYLRGLVVVALVALIVFAPLGLYFIQHPWTFTGRAEALWDPTHPFQKVIGTLAMFSLRGDVDESVNIKGRPALDVFQTAVFLIGLAACMVRRPRRRGLLVLAWLAIMLFTNVTGDQPNSFLHGLGAVPAIALVMGFGLETSLALIARLVHPVSLKSALGAGLLILMCVGLGWSTSLTFTDYFKRWPRSTDLHLAFEENLAAIGSLVRTLPREESIYISPFSEVPPGLAFAMRGDDPRVRVYDGRHCTVIKNAPQQPLTYIVILADKDTLPLLQDKLPGGSTTKTKLFSTYRVTASAPVVLQPQHVTRAVFGHQIQLEGYDASLRSQSGQSFLDLVFYWRALQTVAEPYTVFIHLLSSHGQLQAQYDSPPCGGAFRTDRWLPDEVIVDRYTLALPGDLGAGSFQLNAGLYHSYELQRLAVETELKTTDNMIELPDTLSLGTPR